MEFFFSSFFHVAPRPKTSWRATLHEATYICEGRYLSLSLSLSLSPSLSLSLSIYIYIYIYIYISFILLSSSSQPRRFAYVPSHSLAWKIWFETWSTRTSVTELFKTFVILERLLWNLTHTSTILTGISRTSFMWCILHGFWTVLNNIFRFIYNPLRMHFH